MNDNTWINFGDASMKFEKIKNLKDTQFRRLTGLKKNTFSQMVSILLDAEHKKKKLGGRPNDLCMEDRLLMTMEYLREYRTYFHISESYRLSESACCRNIKWIENVLVQSKEFALPGKKALLKSDTEFEVILIDVSESPIERPKKNKKDFILEKRSVIR